MNSTPDPAGENTPAEETQRPTAQGAVVPDARLVEAHDIALAALREITSADTIGDPAGYLVEGDGVVSLRFETKLLGYPGWFWTASVTAAGDAEPTVMEVELLPGENALLAPEWVPWAVRLEEYRKAQAAAEAERAERLAEESEDDSDEEYDEDDYDADVPLLHAGDVDGVDIDELDENGARYDEAEPDGDAEIGADDREVESGNDAGPGDSGSDPHAAADADADDEAEPGEADSADAAAAPDSADAAAPGATPADADSGQARGSQADST